MPPRPSALSIRYPSSSAPMRGSAETVNGPPPSRGRYDFGARLPRHPGSLADDANDWLTRGGPEGDPERHDAQRDRVHVPVAVDAAGERDRRAASRERRACRVAENTAADAVELTAGADRTPERSHRGHL